MGAINGHYGLLMAATGGAWTPASLTVAPKLWINDSSAVTDAGSGACSQWNDISGSAWHFEQSNSGRRPLIVAAGLNGRRIIRFDGTASEMVTSAAGALDIFKNKSAGWACCVLKSNVSDTNERVALTMTTAAGVARMKVSVQSSALAAGLGSLIVRRLDADSAAQLNNTTNTGTSAHIRMVTMDWSAGDGYSYINGTSDASNLSLTTSGSTSNTSADRPIGLGSFTGFSGGAGIQFASADIAEIVIGDTLPSQADREKLEGYLAHRWGLAGSLPGGHPYKSAPP